MTRHRLSEPQCVLLSRMVLDSYGSVPLLLRGEKQTARALERHGFSTCKWAAYSMIADRAYITDAGRVAIKWLHDEAMDQWNS